MCSINTGSGSKRAASGSSHRRPKYAAQYTQQYTHTYTPTHTHTRTRILYRTRTRTEHVDAVLVHLGFLLQGDKLLVELRERREVVLQVRLQHHRLSVAVGGGGEWLLVVAVVVVVVVVMMVIHRSIVVCGFVFSLDGGVNDQLSRYEQHEAGC